MIIKNTGWYSVTIISMYCYGVSIGAGWEWYYQSLFIVFMIVSAYLSNN